MRKAERTRQFILEKTAPLFNKKGFEGTSLADLEHVTGLTRGSLYGNFSGKEELGTEAFKYAIKKVKDAIHQKLENVSSNKKKLIALLEFYADYVLKPPIPGGCPLLNTAIEADDYHTSIRKVVVKELLNTVNFIAFLLNEGIREGEFKKDTNPHALAYTFFCAVEGAIMFSRVERSTEAMDIIVNHCKNVLEKISV